MRVLDQVERISEILFGLIMVMTFTSAIRALSDHATLNTILWSALGCNIAWGIIDGGLYLIQRLAERGRRRIFLQSVQRADANEGGRLVADALPEGLAPMIGPAEVEKLRVGMLRLKVHGGRVSLTRQDWAGAFGIFSLVVASTFPVVLPFVFIGDVALAMRVSNAVAIASMFVCGILIARYAGLPRILSGAVLVAFGVAMVAIAIALGG